MTRAKWKVRSVPIAVLLLLSLADASAAQETGRLLGRVETPDGTPIPGVTVVPQPLTSASRAFYGAVTDRTGEFRITLPPGQYKVVIMSLGWREVADTVDVAPGVETILNRQMTPASIELEPTPGQPQGILHFISQRQERNRLFRPLTWSGKPEPGPRHAS